MEQQPDHPARFLKPQYFVAATVAVIIVVLSITGFVWAHKGVTVVEDGESRFVKTQAGTVGELLDQQGISIAEGDLVSPGLEMAVEDASTVVIRHAVPVTVETSGEPVELEVIGTTVADALIAAGMDVSSGVHAVPSLDTSIEPGMEICVADAYVRIVQEETEISFETTTAEDPSLPQGTRAVLTKGVPGKQVSIFRVLVVDGVEGLRSLVTERVVSEPIDEVVGIGTRRPAARIVASRSQAKAPASGKKLVVQATGYAPGVDGVGTRTATGASAGYGIIAVDPRVIPLGTKLYVPGYGYGVAADTGGAIKGNKIDLCYDTGTEAIMWGRRNVTITIVQ